MYQQSQKTYFIVIAVYVVAAVFLLGLVFWPQAYNISQTSLAAKIALVIATAVDLILFWSFSQLTVSLKEDFLEFRFWDCKISPVKVRVFRIFGLEWKSKIFYSS